MQDNARDDRDLLVEIKTLLSEVIRRQDAMTLDYTTLRKDHGDHLENHEKRLITVETDRNRLVPEYQNFVARVNNHIQDANSYKAVQEAQAAALRRHMYAIVLVGGLVVGAVDAIIKVLVG